MFLRKIFLAILGVLFLGQMVAVTLDDLQDLYYFSDSEAVEFNPLAAEFLTEVQDLQEMDSALTWWKDIDYDATKDFVDSAVADYASDIRYQYMAIAFLDDPIQKLEAARELIAENTDFAGGYKALIVTYLYDFEATELQDSYTESYAMLQNDLNYFLQYGYDFPGEEYSRLALVYYHILIGDHESAQTYLGLALDNNETWMDDLNLYGFFTRENSLELLKFHIGYLRSMEGGYNDYQVSYYADDLMLYYLEEAMDYPGFIEFFGAEPFSWGQDIQIRLIKVYQETDQTPLALEIITQNNDFEKARDFQDFWLYSSSEEFGDHYDSLLEGSSDPLHIYLLARLLTDAEAKLNQARSLAKKNPKLEYGYHLATQIHYTALAAADAKDPGYEYILADWKKDRQLLSNYSKRFPDSKQAWIADFLYRLRDKDKSGVLKIYQKLKDDSTDDQTSNDLGKIVLDFERADLLFQMKEIDARLYINEQFLDEDKISDFNIVFYYEALYNNSYYDMMVEDATTHPEWQELPDVLYLLSNAYYMLGDYSSTIASIRLLVEKGILGSTFLSYVDAQELLVHPDWQDLLDYAATMPDPDAEENYGDEVLPDDLPPEDF